MLSIPDILLTGRLVLLLTAADGLLGKFGF